MNTNELNNLIEENILEFDTLINKLEERKSSHPNITMTWIHYLNIKKQNLDKAILNANKVLNIIDSIESDMTHESIYILWWLLNTSNTEVTNTI